ncbi:tRNA (guanosine(37)-N1)-methyltransferase TrmD [Candidatus Uhrbacteria bacterium]|nr:tRNA (guanosine(37)-N1)-methyltransferase TrmD [Candidatus Uhrbacteria bacterium]
MAKLKKKQFDVITIFPEVVLPYVQASILGRAQKAKLIEIRAHQLRDFATDKHHKVDDTPYGGGPGMVMKVEVFERAVQAVKGVKARVVLTSASGKIFTQTDAKRLAKYDQLIFLCGRYEGVDQRVEDHVADEALSIGDYVLTGGELPAMVMIDAIARLIPGVIEKESLVRESHSDEGYREHPQYTKPPVYKKWKVPEVLLSGDHKKIEEWRKAHQKE